MQEIARKRGRPRPAETIERDDRIVVLLIMDAWPLQNLAAHLNLTPGQTYNALRRLQRAGRIHVYRNGRQHLWTWNPTAATHA